MTVRLFTFVQLFGRAVATASHLLERGAQHAAALETSEQDMLDWRLIHDMQPLRFQLMVVCNFAQQWPARVAGLPVPPDIGPDLDVAGFRAALEGSAAFLADLRPEQFDNRDDVPLTVEIGGGTLTPTLPAGQWLSVFATTNLYFHLSTAYAILRAHGAPIGKVDLFPTGL